MQKLLKKLDETKTQIKAYCEIILWDQKNAGMCESLVDAESYLLQHLKNVDICQDQKVSHNIICLRMITLL